MAEGTTLVKVIATVGIIALFAALLFPNSGVPVFNNLSAGFPTLGAQFNNPFAPRTWTFTTFADNHDDSVYAPLSVRGAGANQPGYCNADEYPVDNDWYGCLNTADQNATYLTTGFGGFSQGIDVNMSGFPDTTGHWRVISLSVTFQCKGYGSGIQFSFQQDPDPPFEHVGDAVGESSCHLIGSIPDDDSNLAPGFDNATLTVDTTLDGAYAVGQRGFSESTMRIENGGAIGSNDLLFISYVAVTITYQREAGCVFAPTGNPWDDIVRATYFIGCVLGAFFQFLVDGIVFTFNAAMYIGAVIVYVVEWIIYGVTFLADLASVLVWLYAIPGMPSFAQGIIDVILTALIGYLAITILKLIRGSEP